MTPDNVEKMLDKGEYTLEKLLEVAEALNDSQPMKDEGASVELEGWGEGDESELADQIMRAFERNVPENRENEVGEAVLEFYSEMVPQEEYEEESSPEPEREEVEEPKPPPKKEKSKKKVEKKDKKKLTKKKYTRLEAFCEAVKQGGKLEKIISTADNLYVTKGGTSNLKESRMIAKMGLRILVILDVVEEKEGGSYKVG